VATKAPASDHPARDRHQIQTLILAVTIISMVVLAVILVVTFAATLNHYRFLHFPIGFYLLAQGLIIFIVVMAFWFIRVQEGLDSTRSEREGLG
jgi:putative solute:sodium symporter small subunit